MREVIATLETPSGKIFRHVQNMETTDHVGFLWTEGNFGCDCNRSIFAVETGVMEDELDCNTEEPSIKLLSLTVDNEEVLNHE